MSSLISVSCTINTTDATCPLGMEIWLDDVCVFDKDHITETTRFDHSISDQDGQHQLKFVLKGKLPEHTVISESGEIVKDATLTITDLSFDQIALGQIFIEKAVYSHDFNGTGAVTQERFYQHMGCNGTVTLDFSTPAYLWLLENM